MLEKQEKNTAKVREFFQFGKVGTMSACTVIFPNFFFGM